MGGGLFYSPILFPINFEKHFYQIFFPLFSQHGPNNQEVTLKIPLTLSNGNSHNITIAKGLFSPGINLGERLGVLWGMHRGLRKAFISASSESLTRLAKYELLIPNLFLWVNIDLVPVVYHKCTPTSSNVGH